LVDASAAYGRVPSLTLIPTFLNFENQLNPKRDKKEIHTWYIHSADNPLEQTWSFTFNTFEDYLTLSFLLIPANLLFPLLVRQDRSQKMSSQTAPLLDDQLESDRTRQFQEFLDDRVQLFYSESKY